MFTNPCLSFSVFSSRKPSPSNVISGSSQSTNENQDRDIRMKLLKHNLLSVAAAVMNVPTEVFTTSPPLEPFPPKTAEEKEYRRQGNEILSKGWSFTAGYDTMQEEIDEIDRLTGSDDHHLPSTYGEITELGSRQLFNCFGLSSKTNRSSQSNVLFDLGCGVGKLLVQSYLELPSINKIVGIELSKNRYDAATKAWKELQKDAQNYRTTRGYPDASFEIYNGDLYEIDISSATHIYVASLCFTDNMMDNLAKKIIQEGKNVQSVATLKQFPIEYNDSLGGAPSISFIEMSWTKSNGNGAKVFFYNM